MNKVRRTVDNNRRFVVKALGTAIATTAQKPSGAGPFSGGFSDPPTQAGLQDFASWVEALRVALLR